MPRKGFNPQGVRCNFCEQLGHTQRTCPTRKSQGVDYVPTATLPPKAATKPRRKIQQKEPSPRFAYCGADGAIRFGHTLPPDMLPIARCPKMGSYLKWRAIITGEARLAYPRPGATERTWLVPGIPEGQTEEAKLDALNTFVNRIEMWVARELGTKPFLPKNRKSES
jgi:hypothetical protein